MDVVELSNEGLRREYKVTLPGSELTDRIDMILQDFRRTVPMKGFRPGKAPLSLLRQLHGPRARAKAIEDAVQDSTEQLFREREVRPAMQPNINVEAKPDDPLDAPVDYTVDVEVLPVIDVKGFEAPKLVRPVAEPTDEEVDAFLTTIAEQQTHYEPAEEGREAQDGDQLVVDFEGFLGEDAFEGGKGEDIQLVLGSNTFIPGFEEQLTGAKAGEARTVTVTFPEDYGAAHLAGQEARFEVQVKEVRVAQPVALDDDLAKNLGMESLDQLRSQVRTQMAEEDAKVSRSIVKRKLLDHLAEQFDFAVPQGMVDMEYQQIWAQVRQDMLRQGEKTQEELMAMPEPESEEERAEFRQIAERRVRLGLLLSEIGLVNDIQINRDELNRKIVEEARRYPGQEQQVLEYYQKNEDALAQLRAPVYEDKVVDFLFEQGGLEDEAVSREDLRKRFEALDDEPA